jgi:hypothetical protein
MFSEKSARSVSFLRCVPFTEKWKSKPAPVLRPDQRLKQWFIPEHIGFPIGERLLVQIHM